MDFSPLPDGVLNIFGEKMQVEVRGVRTELTLAFSAPFVGLGLGGVAIERPNPQVVGRAAEWNATGAQPGDSVIRGASEFDAGQRYTVVDVPPPDDAGFVTVTLRKYPS
jgi:hypothetical protein